MFVRMSHWKCKKEFWTEDFKLFNKGAVPGVFGLHNMRRGGLRFRKNSLTPRNSLTSLRTAQGLVCDAGDVL